MLRVALCVSFVSAVTLAKAAELETTHLFGFTFGSDVNAVGEKEAESEAVGRFGKSAGTYGAISQALGVKFVPFQNFSIQPTVAVSRFDVSNVPGLDDRRQLAYEAASLELRYRLIDREKAQFGLTVGFDPRWARVDEISGAPVDQYGAALLLIVDKELVDKSIFAAFNFIYEPERDALTGDRRLGAHLRAWPFRRPRGTNQARRLGRSRSALHAQLRWSRSGQVHRQCPVCRPDLLCEVF